MADNHLARNGTTEFDLFSDDDPLSELARIVGYDNRPAMQQLQELEKHRNTVRQEPVLDLEDELLREFQSYDSGGTQPVDVAAAPLVDGPVFEPSAVEAPVSDVSLFVEPTVRWEEQAVAEPEPIMAYEPEPVVAYELEVVVGDNPAAAFEHAAPAFVEPAAEEPVYNAPEFVEPSFEALDLDLERELELSIGYADEPLAAVEAAAEPEWQDEAWVEKAFNATPVEAAQVVEAFSAPAFEAPAFEHAPVQASISEPAAPDVSGADLVDALLADIERFPVPVKQPVSSIAAAAPVRKNAYPFTPTFSRATPVASNSAASQKAFATPIVAAPAVVSVLEAIEPIAPAQTVFLPEERAADPVVVAAAPSLVEPADIEFDMDLDGFELDLSDIDLELDSAEVQALERGVVAAPVSHAVSAPVETVVFSAPAPIPVSEEQPVYEPAIPAAVEFARDEEPAETELPFDPSLIAEAEESLMAIADLEVPQLPVVEQEKPVAYQPDYDLDIDAEMAQLFGTASRAARAAGEHASEDHMFAAAGQAVAAPASNHVEDDFDAFERAMEEDFRQSLKPRQETDPASDHLAVGSGYAAEVDFVEDRRGNMRRVALLAATVAGIAILGGAGVYAWMGGSASGLSNGDPKIILADKTPVKIVPVEKGGKTVPNQDKAVYDRVAGATPAAPQQGTLVSSTEEPIDVVQRTLTPETLPLEGRGDEVLPGVMPQDDEGERLMPDDGQAAQNTGPADDSTPAVSPRKVRTMIVKPDGTLVAREEVAPAATQVASADPVVTPVKTTAVTPAAQANPERSALAEAADVKVEETAPVRPVATTAVTETAAVPASRPTAEQTATTPVAETPAPIQTATIAPGSYVIQIASLPSEGDAQASYNKLSGKFTSVIGGRGVDIKKAEIAGKGTYYRVRIPAGSKQEANELCSRYKSAGGSCLVTR